MNSGIYSIINKVNNRKYYGSAIDIKRRWSEHKLTLNKNLHSNQYLQHSWNKYGQENFEFKIELEVYPEYLLFIEQIYLDNNLDGYNICKKARSTMGRICSEETRKKMSKSNIGKIRSDETKKKLSDVHKGRKMDETVRLKMVGRKLSEQTIQKMIKSRTGQKRSDETKLKMSIWQIGRKMSKEAILKSVENKKINRLKKQGVLN